jgi:tetratricopeptide (TPR) repeat protein
MLLHDAGRPLEAVEAYRWLLETNEPAHFKSVVFGLRGFKGRYNLAMVYQELGDWAGAEEQWRLVVQEVPRYRPGWQGLSDVLLRRGKLTEAMQLAEQLRNDKFLPGEAFVIRVKVALVRGDIATAWSEVENAAREVPADLEPLRTLCQCLFESGNFAEAARGLEEWVRRSPQDASAYQNLGVTYHRLGRLQKAEEGYRQALRHRPDSPILWTFLGNVLNELGQREQAVHAWQEALRLDPSNQELREMLGRIGRLPP